MVQVLNYLLYWYCFTGTSVLSCLLADGGQFVVQELIYLLYWYNSTCLPTC